MFNVVYPKLRLWLFVIRYFFIGKFHCDIPQSYKKYFKIGFYTVWTTIITSVVYSLNTFLVYLKGLLV